MTSPAPAISVAVAPEARRLIEKAAELRNQSPAEFLEHAGEDAAREALLFWAIAEQLGGAKTWSQLAEESGLAVEEIMRAMERMGNDEALDRYIATYPSQSVREEWRERQVARQIVQQSLDRFLKDTKSAANGGDDRSRHS